MADGTPNTIQSRVKLLRNTLRLTQTEFGEKLGVGKTAISKIESEYRPVTDSMLILLCSCFGASKDWLLNGSGPMFKTDMPDPVDQFAAEQNLSPLAKSFISKLLSLSDSELQAVYNFMEGLVDSVRSEQPAPPRPDPGRDQEWTDDEVRAALEEQLALEKKPPGESAAS